MVIKKQVAFALLFQIYTVEHFLSNYEPNFVDQNHVTNVINILCFQYKVLKFLGKFKNLV